MSMQQPDPAVGNANDADNELGRQLIPDSSANGKSQKSGRGAAGSIWHQVVSFLTHVIYPILMAPFFIGVFYMTAAWRLAAPNMSSASCLTRALTDPRKKLSGSMLFALTGGLFRACPSGSRNPDHALVLFIIGLALLFSIVGPLFNIVVTDHNVVPGDSALVSATIVGYILTVYIFLWIGLKFSTYSRAEKAAEKVTQDRTQNPRSVVMKRREAIQYVNQFPDIELNVTPLWALFVGIVASLIECILFKVYSGHFVGAAARFRNLSNEWSALTYATAFFLLTATNSMSWFGLYLLYEQKHHLEVFEDQAQLNVNDVAVAKWSVAWQHLLQEMQSSPMVCSIAPGCSVVLFFETAASLFFGVLYNLFQARALRDLLPIALFVGLHSILLLTGYLYIIVRTQNVIERQHKAISALQNQVQLQVDEAVLEQDDLLLPTLRAKVRVLQSLDRFLLIADPKPKILGTSVDAFRWAIINASLLTINVTFLLLYLVFCYAGTKQVHQQAAKNGGG